MLTANSDQKRIVPTTEQLATISLNEHAGGNGGLCRPDRQRADLGIGPPERWRNDAIGSAALHCYSLSARSMLLWLNAEVSGNGVHQRLQIGN